MWNASGNLPILTEGAAGNVWTAGSNPAQVGPTWIGGLGFDEMSPILVFRNPSNSGVRAQFDSTGLFITNTPGGVVHVRCIVDRIDRYTLLSGTKHVNGNAYGSLKRPASAGGSGAAGATSLIEIYDEFVDYEPSSMTQAFTVNGITTNLNGSPGDAGYGTIGVGVGAADTLFHNGGLILEPGTSAAIYAWAATTGPQGRFFTRWIERKYPAV